MEAIQIFSYIPFIVWQLSFLTLWWLLWVVIRSKRSFIVIGGLICLVGLGLVLKGYAYYYPRMMVKKNVLLYVGPDKSYPTRGILKEGTKVVLVKKRDQWYDISSSSGRGWVYSDDNELEKEL